MLNFIDLLNLQGQMFILMIAGYILRKTVLPKEAKGVLTDLLLSLVLPCNIVNSFRMEFTFDMLRKFGAVLGIACLIQVAAYTLSRVLYKGKPHDMRMVMRYGTIISNSGFLGLPVVEGVFGSIGMMYGSVFIVPMRIMMWTSGIACFSNESDLKKSIKKVAVHPCIIAVYFGLFLLFSQMALPVVLDKTIRGIGGCTTTLSMLVIGLILAESDFHHFVSKPMLEVIGVRLIVMPLIALGLARLFGLETILTGVAVVLTAMPIGSSSAMLAAKYKGDYEFASKCVVISTILSIATIPLWCMLIQG